MVAVAIRSVVNYETFSWLDSAFWWCFLVKVSQCTQYVKIYWHTALDILPVRLVIERTAQALQTLV